MKTLFTRTFILVVGLLLALPFSGTASGQDTIKRTFDVRPGGRLKIDIDMGTVRIEPSKSDKVSVEMIRQVKGVSKQEEKDMLDQHEYTMESTGNNVRIESRFDRDSRGQGLWRRWKSESRFTLEVFIQVPRTYDVDFDTGAGNITVADLNGTVRGQTGAGNINLGEISGSIEVSSGAGNIEVDGAKGLIYVQSGAGNIILDNVRGKLKVGTGAGNITASITSDLSGDSELQSGAGNVLVYLAESVGAEVDAQASIGTAKTEFDLKVSGKWVSKSFAGAVNGGGPMLSMHSGVGNVTLRKY